MQKAIVKMHDFKLINFKLILLQIIKYLKIIKLILVLYQFKQYTFQMKLPLTDKFPNNQLNKLQNHKFYTKYYFEALFNKLRFFNFS